MSKLMKSVLLASGNVTNTGFSTDLLDGEAYEELHCDVLGAVCTGSGPILNAYLDAYDDAGIRLLYSLPIGGPLNFAGGATKSGGLSTGQKTERLDTNWSGYGVRPRKFKFRASLATGSISSASGTYEVRGL